MKILVVLFLISFIILLFLSMHKSNIPSIKYQIYKNSSFKSRIYTLENGLKVYLTRNLDKPKIETNIAIKAGSKNDPKDATGLAHYLEHMLFKGTDKYGTLNFKKEKLLLDKIEDLYEKYRLTHSKNNKLREKIWTEIDSISYQASQYTIPNEYDTMLTSIGATGTNAYTSNDQTVYVNNIPSNQLTKWLQIESERFRNPVFRLFHTELETVYEEKNKGLDNDMKKVFETLLLGLFPNHQYGTQTTIGTVEHLKNPSLKRIRNFYDTYYIPNNMAICMSGDLDYDITINKINKYFGNYKKKKLRKLKVIKEVPIKKPIIKEVYGPQQEMVYFGFRLDGANTTESLLLVMMDMILNNSVAGLIDINLNQEQEIMGGGCFPYILKDYSMHCFYGSPLKDQSLEKVKDLLLSQIEKIKQGNFDNWIMEAIIFDLKNTQIKNYESNSGRVDDFIEAFIYDIPWKSYQKKLKTMSLITKQDIIDFANKNYNQNYVVVYKKSGIDSSIEKVPKPKITAIEINNKSKSPFVKNIIGQSVTPIEPLFINFEIDIEKYTMEIYVKNRNKVNNIEVIYKKNSENERFVIYYIFDRGINHNNKLGLAIDYLNLLGTRQLTSKDKAEKLYKLSSTFNISCSDDKMTISLSGINCNFKQSMKLLETIINDAVPDEEALFILKDKYFKQRENNKQSKGSIKSGLFSYIKYGSESTFTNIMSEDELNDITSKELIYLIHNLTNYKHRILYYGPQNINELKQNISRTNICNNLCDIEKETIFRELPLDKSNVYFVDYDMTQVDIMIIGKGDKLDIDKIPIITLYNNYFGSGMSSIVFQEIREAKALAYSVNSRYTIPADPKDSHYLIASIGTQADKLNEAIESILNLLNNIPELNEKLDTVKQSLISKLRTRRYTRESILGKYEAIKQLEIDYDLNSVTYEKIPNINLNEIIDFHNTYIKKSKYSFLIMGSKEKINFKALEKYGNIKELSLNDIFGY
jgi:predicted Zn-dependent peptidase